MNSTDNLNEIIKKYPTKIFTHPHLDWVEPARNFGISKASGEWILILDPDERIPQTLARQLALISQENQVDVVNLPRQNYIFGRWVKHTNWWPDYQYRFFKKGHLTWQDKIHSYPSITGRIQKLPAQKENAIEHHAYNDISQYLTRLNRYTEIEAKNRFEAGERFSYFNLFWQPLREFLQRYLKHLGFLDGTLGLTLSYLQFLSKLTVEIKLWEKEHLAS